MTDPDTTSSSDFTHDVFLISSEGNSKRFTDHIYDSLLSNRITAVRYDVATHSILDDKTIIEKCRMSMIVFCEYFANSTSHLDELVKILDCYDAKKKQQQQVSIIFYKVEPSDVWLQKNSYETALIEHQKKGFQSDKVKAWKSALSRIKELGGEHCRDDKYESRFLEKFITDTFAKLPPPPLDFEIKHPVGLVSRFERVKSLLDVESNNGVCMLLICGDAGIGKTTLAAYLYNKIRYQFEAASFLTNVKEKSINNSINGLRELKKTLLFETVKETQSINVDSTKIIKDKLCNKKVLLILDDVDSIKQLEALAGGSDWFGSGSRIIITTRVETELDKHDVAIKKYKVEELNSFESLELLCRFAFKTSQPEEHYADICNHVVSYTKGFPRALKVLGSNLKNLGPEEWTMELEKYRKVPGAFSFLVDSL